MKVLLEAFEYGKNLKLVQNPRFTVSVCEFMRNRKDCFWRFDPRFTCGQSRRRALQDESEKASTALKDLPSRKIRPVIFCAFERSVREANMNMSWFCWPVTLPPEDLS